MTFQNRVLLLILLLGLSLTALSSHSLAQDPPAPADSSCDPLYYDTLESRAWLEAQREITQNQNLIFKPDSVLQYTCFDKHLGAATKNIKDMFSEEALLGEVDEIAKAYIKANFEGEGSPPNMLGQRSDEKYIPDGGIDESDYSCDVMNKIWKEARCMDFIDEAGSDGFFTLKEYVDAPQDKRFVAGSCSKSGDWQTEYDALQDDGTAWEEDKVKTFLDKIDPTQCSSSKAIETGVQILGNDVSTTAYPERFCIIAGCYNDPKTDSCQSTPP